MSRAIKATSARARATEAARLLKTIKPWPVGYGLGHNFDNCFEMNDGDEVLRLLLLKAAADESLRRTMRVHEAQTGTWAEQAEALRTMATPSRPQDHKPRVQVEPEHQILIR